MNSSCSARHLARLGWALLPIVSWGCSPADSPAQACDQGSACRDSDCDAICDADEGYPTQDTDGDGTPDYLDSDSDNDGYDDRREAGDDDLSTPPADRDHSGLPDFLEADYPDAKEPAAAAEDGGDHSDAERPLSGMDAGRPDASPPDAGQPVDSAAPDPVALMCLSPIDKGCIADEQHSCDGVDNDCDGEVDEGSFCPCGARGEVRTCFRGSPGQRRVGACSDGVQVCAGGEFAAWGPCTGGNLPEPEQCDEVDNDCNGCADDLEACKPVLTCPAPGDPRVPVGRPFTPYSLDARAFYSGQDALAYHWRVSGSPCDTLFQTLDPNASAESGKLSYSLRNPYGQVATVDFSLSGDYPVELTVDTPAGPQTCTFAVPVRAPGLRVELCWDQTGPIAAQQQRRVDLDLHLGKQGATQAWEDDSDCYWGTCKGLDSPFGYATTPLDRCKGSQNTSVYENPLVNACPNPRLDADNRLDAASAQAYITENINLDIPRTGDIYRVMVQYNTNMPTDRGVTMPIATHPLVNIYCGGTRLATFGGDPSVLGADDPEEVQAFERAGQRWHVADVQVTEGGEQARCGLSSLDDNGAYLVTDDGGMPF